jgi:hypothetical protein
MKGANENNCQFKFVNKFSPAAVAVTMNPKQRLEKALDVVNETPTRLVAHALPVKQRAGLPVRPPQPAFSQTSFLECQVLQARAELADVHRRNQSMQLQLQEQQSKIDQLSLALNEYVNGDFSQSGPRLREICLPLLSQNSTVLEPTPITVELDDHGNPIGLQDWNPEVITIKSAGNAILIEKMIPEKLMPEKVTAEAFTPEPLTSAPLTAESWDTTPPTDIAAHCSETLSIDPASQQPNPPSNLRINLPTLPR